MQHEAERKIAIIGLGYVGLPVAVEFSKAQDVIAFDINESRINSLRQGIDLTKEVEPSELKSESLNFTSSMEDLRKADFYIVAVPTPIDDANKPDLSAMSAASKTVARVLNAGDIVVYESTVYPGVTEDHCVPILEEVSGLKHGDFFVGYSPERINPGDKEHTFTKITKVVAGDNNETLEIVAGVYSSVVTAGVYKAKSIKVAEAAKVIENTQRDLNIALMNELSLIFHRMGIDTNDVVDAASTKWNFLEFRPGLVGGHCIGVDPYYLTYQAERFGYTPRVILSGRKINDNIGKFIAENTIKEMVKADKKIKNARVGILGLTFKENCPDIRNSRVVDIIKELQSYGVNLIVTDPYACPETVNESYGIKMQNLDELNNLDAVILAVAHNEYKVDGFDYLDRICSENSVLIDVKAIVPREIKFKNISLLWRL